MRMYDLIAKKRDGGVLSEEEIRWMIRGYTDGIIPHEQMSAFAMAVFFRGMNTPETAALTMAMAQSGDTVDLSLFRDLSADKHSTGGVGDKTTLIVAPLVAAGGLKVAKMSGRGLGHTGGTVDKLESFPGYRTALSSEEFLSQVEKIGICVVGQSGELAPADKKLYALRDVTATVNSIPLIASSIMSKKIAAGTKNIVLDVKVGSGAFMKSREEAVLLAGEMVALGKACGRRVSAVLSDMDRPLGYAVGNILEVKEAIDVLKGRNVSDLREVSLTLSARLFSLGLGLPEPAARRKAEEILDSGRAYGKFLEWITAQGGDAILAEHPERFPEACCKREIRCEKAAYITRMNAEEIGRCAVLLGAGRATKEESIDLTAGIVLEKKTGDRAEAGALLATLYADSEEKLDSGEKVFREALTFGDAPRTDEPLILGVI